MNFNQVIHTKKIIGLAPMDGYTNAAFRLTQTEIAKPDVVYTEFVSAEGLCHGGIKLFETLLYSSIERPIIGQLFGKDPVSFYKSTVILCHLGFDGIDLNFGCPAKKIVHHGSGAVLIGQLKLVSTIIKQSQQAIDDWFNNKVTVNDLGLNKKTIDQIMCNLRYTGPITKIKPTFSIKTRLGIDKSTVNTWIPFLLSFSPDFITIHGRTLKQGYSGISDWNEIEKAVNLSQNTKTLIWGNGDIATRRQGIDYCTKYGVNGVLIGRSALSNPWVFANKTAEPSEKFQVMQRLTKNFQNIFPKKGLDCLRKYYLLYASEFSHAKQLRQKIVKIKSITDLYALEADFSN